MSRIDRMAESNLYLLKLLDATWEYTDSFVVRAVSTLEARRLASQNARCEGPEVWMDGLKSTCQELSQDGRPEVVIRHTRYG